MNDVSLCVVWDFAMFGLKFGLCVIARFRKDRGTKDNGWLCGRGGSCGAVGVTSMLLCSSLYVFCVVCYFCIIFFDLCV